MQLIMLHGMGQSASSWDKTTALLSPDINAVCPELSEFFIRGECNYSAMYSAFCKYLDCFERPLNLCGLSLGAVLALNYAADHPQDVGSLILFAPQFDMPKALLKFQNVVFKFMPNKMFADIGFTKKDFISLTNSMADIDLSDRLSAINCPVLIACGEKDKTNIKAARQLTEKLSSAEFTLVSGAGHEVNTDAPEKLAKLLTTWCKGIQEVMEK
ncbi:MAG: alpha/beta hydrolase [Ruminococcaceae bacterium]|nr:alpha/beta hydrolase [Oscillospiraceae bacterium]